MNETINFFPRKKGNGDNLKKSHWPVLMILSLRGSNDFIFINGYQPYLISKDQIIRFIPPGTAMFNNIR